MPNWLKPVTEWTTFLADVVTLTLGIIALLALIFHRDKISQIAQILTSTFTSERVKRIKETLTKLDSISYENKDSRPEIHALLGQVSGQIKGLGSSENGLEKIRCEIMDVLDQKLPLDEAKKRRIVYETHGELDTLTLSATKKIIK